ncbi:putative pantothenate transporter [Bombardia bombarda]|uniref:Pantothenate transporter n=1 Tax=Bombardia bombarda TaxID=252184 RepID=A0AA40BV64_9PEZI|nr:putative pantothenate transporter [Bombardia bombarda]
MELELDTSRDTSVNGLAVHDEAVLTPEERRAEKWFVLKIDFIILPLIAIIYFLAALDRSDVGNAAVAGMTDDLKLTPGELSNCVAFIFIGLMLMQLPGALLVRLLTPPIQLGCALIAWGTATTLICEAQNWQTIAGLRVVVGLFEAFIQGAPLYLTLWYKQHELATRGAIFASMQSVAGSMNGLIAYAIQNTMDGRLGRPAWRWLFLIEGVVSVGAGVVMVFVLPPAPENIKRGFTKAEREIALRRTKEAYNVPHTTIHLKQLLAVLKDKKILFYCLLNGCTSISSTAWSQFLPVILHNAGYTQTETQVLTIPVYVVSGVVTIAIGYLSDRFHMRGSPLIASYLIAVAGWIMLLATRDMRTAYAGTFLIGMGSQTTVILQLAWLNSNVIGYTKKGGSLAIANIFGQLCALASSFSFRDGPDYFTGKGLSLAATGVGAILTAVFMLYLGRLNMVKLANKDTVNAAEQRKRGVEDLCDAHPDFMYSL